VPYQLSSVGSDPPRIELDLTADEAIVAMTHRLGIFWNPLDNVTK
jgi:hypothetical protein